MKRSRELDEVTDSPDRDSPSWDGSEPDSADIPATKFAQLDSDSSKPGGGNTMKCSLPPHKDVLSFDTYEEYEVHYNRSHLNRCVECRKNFPSEHLLNVHIEECHDSLVAVRRDRGEHTVNASPGP